MAEMYCEDCGSGMVMMCLNCLDEEQEFVNGIQIELKQLIRSGIVRRNKATGSAVVELYLSAEMLERLGSNETEG